MLLDAKDPTEEVTITFDYAARGNAVANPLITVRLIAGVDTNPADIISGYPSVLGTRIMQRIKNGVPSCLYEINCLADVDGDRLKLSATLPVNWSCPYS